MVGDLKEVASRQDMSFASWMLFSIFGSEFGSSFLHRRVFINACFFLRRVPKPTAVPNAMGRRIEAAGFWNTAEGIVMAGT